MNLAPGKIKKLLLQSNYLTEDDFKKAEKNSGGEKGALDYLISHGILTKRIIGEAIAESLKVPYADLSDNSYRIYISKIPKDFAEINRAILFRLEGDKATVATDDVKQSRLPKKLTKFLKGADIEIAYTFPEDIDVALSAYHKELDTRFNSIIKRNPNAAPDILREIIKDAILLQASDIHFEPDADETVIRFRIDGVLNTVGRIEKNYYLNVLNLIKLQANMRMDEHFTAQDGVMRINTEGKAYDLRLSIVPIIDGEKVAMRIQVSYGQGIRLDDLGLSKNYQGVLKNSAKKPFGMILTTGPTGSGKTTTLYTILKMINDPDINITTIEDPVEYKIKGINQIQVRAQSNLTFDKGLRSIIRQDPDVILVGEIRDGETAELAVNAALTGHLLLSTFHANDSATAIPRLIDMGVEPFLLASTLEVVIAQRLLRKICNTCRYSFEVTPEQVKKEYPEAAAYFKTKTSLYAGKGCESCKDTGYKGRVGLFEFIETTPAMRELILKNPSKRDVWKLARSEGARSLFEDGVDKAKSGLTTLKEVLRVSEPSEV